MKVVYVLLFCTGCVWPCTSQIVFYFLPLYHCAPVFYRGNFDTFYMNANLKDISNVFQGI